MAQLNAEHSHKPRSPRYGRRLLVVGVFFILMTSILTYRIYQLVILDRDFLLQQGHARTLRVINIPANRGMILDRNGAALAVSTPVQSVWVNPKTFVVDAPLQAQLARWIGVTPTQLSQQLEQAKTREFFYLKRQVTPLIAKKIADLKIPGVNFQEEFKRYYPEADSTAQLIGFTNVDDNGIEGLELAFNDWLRAEPGKKRVIKDRLGRVVESLDLIKAPTAGHVLQLSIDKRIQYVAYHELQKTVEKFGAKMGSVMVVDTRTGEVLAVANAPSFNPHVRIQYPTESYRNRAFTDLFEPGSVIKPLSVASALESGFYKPNTIVDTRPGWMPLAGHTIRDGRNYGVLDVTGVLQHSSNVGVTKMVLSSPPERLIDLLTRAGFGVRTESNYPGESAGTMVRVKQASPFVLATLSFGYGMSTTVAQLAQSYLVFANEGRLLPISLLHPSQSTDKTEVMSPKTAQEVLLMMEKVISGDAATGRFAQVPGYRVAGKTGTARVAGKKGYESSRHLASFVGIAPVSSPRLLVVILIQEPSRQGYYAAQVAAPLFASVMGTSLRILDIPADNRS